MAVVEDLDVQCEHEWGEPVVLSFDNGALDGDWTRRECVSCPAFEMLPVGSDDDSPFAAWVETNLTVIDSPSS